jgi:hypothetical protein
MSRLCFLVFSHPTLHARSFSLHSSLSSFMDLFRLPFLFFFIKYIFSYWKQIGIQLFLVLDNPFYTQWTALTVHDEALSCGACGYKETMYILIPWPKMPAYAHGGLATGCLHGGVFFKESMFDWVWQFQLSSIIM